MCYNGGMGKPVILHPVDLQEGEDLLIVTAEDRHGHTYRIEISLHEIFTLLYPTEDGEVK